MAPLWKSDFQRQFLPNVVLLSTIYIHLFTNNWTQQTSLGWLSLRLIRCSDALKACVMLRVWKPIQIAAIAQHRSINNRPPDKELEHFADIWARNPGVSVFLLNVQTGSTAGSHTTESFVCLSGVFFVCLFLSTLLIMLIMDWLTKSWMFHFLSSKHLKHRC